MDPNNPEDRKKILVHNLRALANEIEDGRSEIVFSDSIGFIGWGEPPEADVFVVASFTTIGGMPSQIPPERAAKIYGALEAAMAQVKTP